MFHVRQTDQQCRRHALNMLVGREDLTSAVFEEYMQSFAKMYPSLPDPRDFDAIVSHQDNIISYVLRWRYGYESLYIAPYSLPELEHQLGLPFESMIDPSLGCFMQTDPEGRHVWSVARHGGSSGASTPSAPTVPTAPSAPFTSTWYRLDSMQPGPSAVCVGDTYSLNRSSGDKHGYIIPLSPGHALLMAQRAQAFIVDYFVFHPLFFQAHANRMKAPDVQSRYSLVVNDGTLQEDFKGFLSTDDEIKAIKSYHRSFLRDISAQREASLRAPYDRSQSVFREYRRGRQSSRDVTAYLEGRVPLIPHDIEAMHGVALPPPGQTVEFPRVFQAITRVVLADLDQTSLFSAYECLLNRFFIWWDYWIHSSAVPLQTKSAVRNLSQSAANMFGWFQASPADTNMLRCELPFLVYFVFSASLGE